MYEKGWRGIGGKKAMKVGGERGERLGRDGKWKSNK
jgi:hypothetical protein